MKLLLKFVAGPLAFLVLYFLPYEGPSPELRVALAIFGWVILWWMTQPVPWGISSLLPLLMFPAFGLMSIGNTVSFYGQNIFFWIMGTVLMGYAMHRHGLAKRFALWFLSMKVVSGSTHRLAFGFMLVTGCLSMWVSDAATVAMMIPVGVSLVSFVKTVTGTSASEKSNFGAFLALGALYGAVAGGTATIMGIPHNALAVELINNYTGRNFGFFDWMKAGIPIFMATLVAFYFILRWFLPPEVSEIPGGQEFILAEQEKLGPLTAGEKATLFVFLAMIFLFTLPTLIDLTLGPDHQIAQWGDTALSIWIVPPTVMLLLFSTPVNWSKGEFVLTWREAVEHSPWGIMFLCTAAVAITGALNEFGFQAFAGNLMSGLGLGYYSLPVTSAPLVALSTNFISGTAATTLFGHILIPAAQEIGFNPASIGMLIANVALGIMLPWAGAAAGTAFATGEVDMKNMIRVGAVATIVFSILVAGIHILLAPYL
ncbi:MAG: SLC13 family permease [Acidobacteria bacterium]|nr:SLC13 family permease [Acidobacteriota bacterium]